MAAQVRSSGNRSRVALGVAVAVGIAIAFWMLRPSAASRVRNLDSRGTAIVAFGDSLTAGFGAGGGEDYPSVLSAEIGASVINAGRSGDTTAAAMARLEGEVLARDPRIVIVGLGGNDFLRGVSISETEANLRAIVQRIQEGGAMAVLLGFEFPSLRADYGAMYERVAEEEGCLFVPDLLDGILSDPALRSDAIHPNGRGYAIMAARVAGPLAELIEEANAVR